MAQTFKLKRLTPVLMVKAIEPCLPFWTGKLGFKVTIQVPELGPKDFVALERDGLEVMYQTLESVGRDLPKLAGLEVKASCGLYFEVENLEAVERALEGAEVVMPRRRAFYGAEEIFVREPGGHVVAFSQHG